jgi:hypothetical protein
VVQEREWVIFVGIALAVSLYRDLIDSIHGPTRLIIYVVVLVIAASFLLFLRFGAYRQRAVPIINPYLGWACRCIACERSGNGIQRNTAVA